nr:hypothetical protein [Nocardia sp. MH4]
MIGRIGDRLQQIHPDAVDRSVRHDYRPNTPRPPTKREQQGRPGQHAREIEDDIPRWAVSDDGEHRQVPDDPDRTADKGQRPESPGRGASRQPAAPAELLSDREDRLQDEDRNDPHRRRRDLVERVERPDPRCHRDARLDGGDGGDEADADACPPGCAAPPGGERLAERSGSAGEPQDDRGEERGQLQDRNDQVVEIRGDEPKDHRDGQGVAQHDRDPEEPRDIGESRSGRIAARTDCCHGCPLPPATESLPASPRVDVDNGLYRTEFVVEKHASWFMHGP